MSTTSRAYFERTERPTGGPKPIGGSEGRIVRASGETPHKPCSTPGCAGDADLGREKCARCYAGKGPVKEVRPVVIPPSSPAALKIVGEEPAETAAATPLKRWSRTTACSRKGCAAPVPAGNNRYCDAHKWKPASTDAKPCRKPGCDSTFRAVGAQRYCEAHRPGANDRPASAPAPATKPPPTVAAAPAPRKRAVAPSSSAFPLQALGEAMRGLGMTACHIEARLDAAGVVRVERVELKP